MQRTGYGELDGRVTPGPMGALVESFNWASTPIGPASAWPESLRTTVRILLTSRFPMWMAWGPELTFLYNDAYARTTLGKKHPWALGRPAHAGLAGNLEGYRAAHSSRDGHRRGIVG